MWRRGQNPYLTELNNSIMELHCSTYKAPPISNYTALSEIWSFIKFTHRISCHAHGCHAIVFQPGWHTFLNQSRVHYEAEFSEWLRRVLWGRILRERYHERRLWKGLDVKWLWWVVQWRGRTPLVYRYHVISRIYSKSSGVWWSTERHSPQRMTVGQLLYSSDCRGTGRAMQDAGKSFDSRI